MNKCQMCGKPIGDGKEYCYACQVYIDESYKAMEREAEYREEMRKDVFGEVEP